MSVCMQMMELSADSINIAFVLQTSQKLIETIFFHLEKTTQIFDNSLSIGRSAKVEEQRMHIVEQTLF